MTDEMRNEHPVQQDGAVIWRNCIINLVVPYMLSKGASEKESLTREQRGDCGRSADIYRGVVEERGI
jgi:hypothetical protein